MLAEPRAIARALKRLTLIQHPYDSGIRDFRMGHGARILGDEGTIRQLADAGFDVEVTSVEATSKPGYEIRRTFAVLSGLAERVGTAVATKCFPIVLAGNCNSAVGTTAALARKNLGVVWFDAHADFDTPEDNRSGFFDVFALSILVGDAWQALARTLDERFSPVSQERVVLAAVRDLEPYQAERLQASRLNVVLAAAIAEEGIEAAFTPALARATEDADALYVHVDLDALDPSEGVANPYAAPSGLSRGALSDAFAAIQATRVPVVAAAVSAYDPAGDAAGRMAATARGVIAEIARQFA